MDRYTVQWNYRAGKRGPWSVGDVVELSSDEAAATLADSPGVIVPVDARPAPVLRDVVEAQADRMVRAAGRRRNTLQEPR